MMKNLILFLGILLTTNIVNAQDDIYDEPEPTKLDVVYTSNISNTMPDNPRTNYDYEAIDDYNSNFDYRYSRSLRRMYDPFYVMPGSAYINMYSYPQFNSFYNPYWGGTGFSISVGNVWGSPYSSWGLGWNSIYPRWGYGGWNAWNNPWNYGWNSGFYGGWNNPYWGGGWNSWCPSVNNGWNSWNRGYYSNAYYGGNRWGNNARRGNYINVDGRRAHSNATLPQRSANRAKTRLQNGRNSNAGFSRTTIPSRRISSPSTNVNRNRSTSSFQRRSNSNNSNANFNRSTNRRSNSASVRTSGGSGFSKSSSGSSSSGRESRSSRSRGGRF